ncbi:putative NAD(P)-binding domain superfamily [Dioscorea sansibarensis]
MQLYCIVILGGSGFVGIAICKAAVSKGIKVVSLSRSGRPSYSDSWVDQVTWVAGDVFSARWDEVLVGATAVISTFLWLLHVRAPKFILISVHDYNLLSFLLSSSYFTGKRKAKYPSSVVLRPCFIYGKKKSRWLQDPITFNRRTIGKVVICTENFANPLSSLPTSDLPLTPPMSVDDVAFTVLNAVLDDVFFGVFTIEQIKKAAAKLRI